MRRYRFFLSCPPEEDQGKVFPFPYMRSCPPRGKNIFFLNELPLPSPLSTLTHVLPLPRKELNVTPPGSSTTLAFLGKKENPPSTPPLLYPRNQPVLDPSRFIT